MYDKPITRIREIRHAHLFCGIGVGARGFNRASPRIRHVQGKFVCAGGIDVDAGAIRNFGMMTGTPGTVMDLFDREQYVAFHGRQPPENWREASPADVYAAFGPNIDVAFTSSPCKGFSGLLATEKAVTDKYQALNRLTLRGVWLLLEAYKDEPIPVILFENVPRILTRGKWLLDQITALMRAYGYNVNLDTHDCGVIGGLAQSRKRALLIARHTEKVPPFIYQPRHHSLKGVGEVIGLLPLPGDPVAGPMHRVPALQWKTWVRLAMVPAGKDWRALNDLAVTDGFLRDFAIVPEAPMRDNALGVNAWSDTAPVIIGQRSPGQGGFSVADPRPIKPNWHHGSHGVRDWTHTAHVVTGASRPANGAHSVADPRPDATWQSDVLGVRDWTAPSGVVAGRNSPTNGVYSVADPRPPEDANQTYKQYGVNNWENPVGTVSGQSLPGGGAHSVADPRLGRKAHSNIYRVISCGPTATAITSSRDVAIADPRPQSGQGRHTNIMRVTPYDEPAGTIAANPHSVTGEQSCVTDPQRIATSAADPGYPSALPQPDERLVCRIIAPDDTWHRPFTTLDLGALQSLFDPEEIFHQEDGVWRCSEAFDLIGASDVTKREWIGNAVPGASATGMATTIGETLLLAEQGETFMLSSADIWVKPGALALAIDNNQPAFQLDSSQ